MQGKKEGEFIAQRREQRFNKAEKSTEDVCKVRFVA